MDVVESLPEMIVAYAKVSTKTGGKSEIPTKARAQLQYG
jgi:hypothetical protein